MTLELISFDGLWKRLGGKFAASKKNPSEISNPHPIMSAVSQLMDHCTMVYLTCGEEIEIGRTTPMSLVSSNVKRCQLNMPALSFRHAFLGVDLDGIYVVDVGSHGRGSTNGTYVRGERLQAGVKRYLDNGDCVWFGKPDQVLSVKLSWAANGGQYAAKIRGLVPRTDVFKNIAN